MEDRGAAPTCITTRLLSLLNPYFSVTLCMKTLEEAKAYLSENMLKGTKCPCCKQFVKIYKRQIYKTMALGLIELYRQGGVKDFVHITTLLNNPEIAARGLGGDFSKLALWGLIEEKENSETKKRTSGLWRLTEKGINFIKGKSSVPKYVFIYNGKLAEKSAEHVSIRDVLGKEFDYTSLIQENAE